MSEAVVNKRAKTPLACVIFSVLAVVLIIADQFFKRLVVAKVGVYE